jgi:hypothetical protein
MPRPTQTFQSWRKGGGWRAAGCRQQGLESLFGGHHGMLGGSGILGIGTPEIIENNTVINEYPDPGLDPLGSSGSGFADGYADADLGGDSDPFGGGDADPVGEENDSTDWI